MNYPFRTAVLELLQGSRSGAQTAEVIQRIINAYPWENMLCMFNLLGSHDTERIKTMLGGKVEIIRLAYSLLFALPGAPAIYYGDEIGIEGGKDPDCRRAFIWDKKKWNNDLHDWIKSLIQLRKNHSALCIGGFEIVYASEAEPVLAVKRASEDGAVVVIVNATSKSQDLAFSSGSQNNPSEGEIEDLLGQKISAVWQDGNLKTTLPPFSSAYFKI